MRRAGEVKSSIIAIDKTACDFRSFPTVQARRGGVTGEKEEPYAAPSSEETTVYIELKKKLKIRTFAGSNIE